MPSLLKSAPIGLMLGVLRADRANSEQNTRVIFDQSEGHSDYLYHLCGLIFAFVGSPLEPLIGSQINELVRFIAFY